MKELIEKFNQLDYEINLALNDQSKYEKDLFVGVTNCLEEFRTLLQALTSVKSESTEEKKQHAIDEAFIEWYVTNGFRRNSDGFHRTGDRVGMKFIIEELYNEYLNTLNNPDRV